MKTDRKPDSNNKTKKTTATDRRKQNPYYKEYGIISNCLYVLKQIMKHKKALFFMTLVLFLCTPVQMYSGSYITKLVLDLVTGQYSLGAKQIIIIAISVTALLLLVNFLTGFVQNYSGWMYMLVRMRMVREKNLKTMTMDFYNLEDQQVLDIYWRAGQACNGTYQGVEGLMRMLSDVFVQLGVVVVGIAILTSLNAWLVLAMCVMAVLNAFMSTMASRKCKREVWDVLAPWWRKRWYMDRISSNFDTAKDIRMFGLKNWLLDKYRALNDYRYELEILNQKVWFLCSLWHTFSWIFVQAFLYGYLIYSVFTGKLTVGNFSLYLSAAMTFFTYINNITGKFAELIARNREVNDFRSFMDFERRPLDKARGDIPSSGDHTVIPSEAKESDRKDVSTTIRANARLLRGNYLSRRKSDLSIDMTNNTVILSEARSAESKNLLPVPEMDKYEFVFENVSFKYPGAEKYALKNLNLTLKAGESLAVVGLNGAGKTTFIKLLLRLYVPTEGRILLNGVDVQVYERDSYFGIFSPLFQDVSLFAFPLAENVSMKTPEETDREKAEQKLVDAGMKEKLDSLKDGIETQVLKIVYDDGVDFSGGEKQKLALARALYKDSPVVVLDEPTAALDAIAEGKLYNDFNRLIAGKTSVFISHRLSSTQFCNNVAMFKDGQMVEYGDHKTLLSKNGEYANMWKIQSQYYVDSE